jgi:tetratricopeptide (TPR) repeat protein
MNASAEAKLNQIMHLNGSGRAADALIECERLVGDFPDYADACHLLGVLYCGSGQLARGLDCLRRAVELNPSDAEMQSNLGNVLHATGRTLDALACFDRAIALDPEFIQIRVNRAIARRVVKDWSGALGDLQVAISSLGASATADLFANQGVVLSELGRSEEALQSFDQALALNPHYFDAIRNKGLVLQRLGRYTEALQCFDRALQMQPSHVLLHTDRGNALNALQRYQEARDAHLSSIRIDPAYAEGHANLGVTLDNLGRTDEALKALAVAARNRPENGSIRYNYASLLLKSGEFARALTEIDAAIDLGHDSADAYSNKACMLEKLGRYGDAWDAIEIAAFRDSDNADVWLNRGVILEKFNQFDLAVEAYVRSLQLRPRSGLALRGLAHARKEQKRFTDAMVACDQSIELGGEDEIEGLWAKSFLNLHLGDFSLGWSQYEVRWKLKEFLKDHGKFLPLKFWSPGENLHGKSTLVIPEQGLGDSIQFCRYLRVLEQTGARVTLLAPRPLYALFKSNFGAEISVVDTLDLRASFDFRVPMLSLPRMFSISADQIPLADREYLSSPKEKSDEWGRLIESERSPKIGLMWSGRDNPKLSERSIRLSDLNHLLDHPATWISLQKEIRSSDAESLELAVSKGLRHFGDRQGSFVDVAGIIGNLDLVISIDTGVAHLAAAMGKPTWIMLPYSADWRWLENIDHSIWYPSVRLFRQSADRQWLPVVNQVTHALQAWASTVVMP